MNDGNSGSLSPGTVAELVIGALVGRLSIDRVADDLQVSRGQVLGWCEEVKSSLTDAAPRQPLWEPSADALILTHEAVCAEVRPNEPVDFVITVINNSPVSLYGLHVIIRSFTNPLLEPLTLATGMHPVSGPIDSLEPGEQIQFTARYLLEEEDFERPGELILAAAVKAFTPAGACFYCELDGDLNLTRPA